MVQCFLVGNTFPCVGISVVFIDFTALAIVSLIDFEEETKTHANYDKAIRAISLFRTQEPEAFARVFYRSTSILQPFLQIGEPPAPLGKNRLHEIEEEILREQEQKNNISRQNTTTNTKV